MKRFPRSKLFLSSIALVLIVVGLFTLFLRQQAVQAATGDWSTFLFDNSRSGFNGAETVINQQTTPKLKVHWTHAAGASISDEPVVANGMLHSRPVAPVEHAIGRYRLGADMRKCHSRPVDFQSRSSLFIDRGLGCIEAGAGIVKEEGRPIARGSVGGLVPHKDKGGADSNHTQDDRRQDELRSEQAFHACSPSLSRSRKNLLLVISLSDLILKAEMYIRENGKVVANRSRYAYNFLFFSASSGNNPRVTSPRIAQNCQ